MKYDKILVFVTVNCIIMIVFPPVHFSTEYHLNGNSLLECHESQIYFVRIKRADFFWFKLICEWKSSASHTEINNVQQQQALRSEDYNALCLIQWVFILHAVRIDEMSSFHLHFQL